MPEVALGCVLLGAVLAVGAVHVPVALSVAIASGVLASVLLGQGKLPQAARLPSAAAFGLGIYSALQALPLPRGVTALVAPATVAVWDRSLEHFAGTPAWIPVSLDPGASLVEAAKWMGYGSMIVAAAVVARRRGVTPVLAIVLAVGLISALLACAHLALGATHLYGVYERKLAVTPWGVAPLLNPNNFAGYLNFAAIIGFGMMLARHPLFHPLFFALALAFILAVSLLTGSRGAALSLLLGLVLLVWALKRSSRSRTSSWRGRATRYAPVVLVVMVALGLAVLGSRRDAYLGFGQASTEKLSIVRWTVPMILDHPWFGVGRGAFETAFPAYREGLGRLMYQYPENLIAQWISEWGLIVGIGALSVFGWCLRPARLNLADDIRARSAHVALLVLLVHNLVDLSLEVSGVATSFFAVLGTLCGAERVRDAAESPPDLRAPTWLPGVATAALAALGLTFGRSPALADRLELHAAYTTLDMKQQQSGTLLMQHIEDAIRRHPGDPYLPYLGGLLQARLGKDPVPWFNRAIERDPKRGLPYYMLSRLLFPRSMLDQAWLHARLAVERQPELSHSIAPVAIAHTSKMSDLVRGIPQDGAGLTFLLALAREAKHRGRGEVTEQSLLGEATRRYPDSARPLVFEARVLADALERPSDSECAEGARNQCIERLARNLQRLERTDPASLETILLRARYWCIIGKAAEADELLSRRCPELGGTTDCWQARARAAVKSRDPERVEAASTAYLALACESSGACSKALLSIGDMHMQERDWVGAMNYYGRAAREYPSRTAWSRLSRAAKQAGYGKRALEAEQRSHRTVAETD